jgi:hypothetical protein
VDICLHHRLQRDRAGTLVAGAAVAANEKPRPGGTGALRAKDWGG